MYEKLCVILLIILVAPTNNVFGKEENQTHSNKGTKHHDKFKTDSSKVKKYTTISRAKRQSPRSPNFGLKYDSDEKVENYDKMDEKLREESPFWATRGRRQSSEVNSIDYMPPKLQKVCMYCKNIKLCKFCFGAVNKLSYDFDSDSWERQARSSEIDDDVEPFWGNRGRRQEQDEPFWGTRGRRQEDPPFWGNRGRRDKLNNRAIEEDGVFWGNRGRRMQSDESVGYENEESGPFWGNRGRRKEDIKEAIMKAINEVETKIKHISRFQKRQDNPPALSFWANRNRFSKLQNLFNSKIVTKIPKGFRLPEPGTVLDDRIFAEQPGYILVERSSRSSAEDDPYYLSRGKKRYYRYLKSELDEVARDRRGSIEEIVKSVRNDPYYIVRGKKEDQNNKIKNSTYREDFVKVKDLICSSIDLVTKHDDKVKRDTNEENDRDRRNILKKLAEQLQIDPYFVSRGKKSGVDNTSTESVIDFVNQVADKCYN